MPDDYYYSGGRRVPLVRRSDLVAVRFREPQRALRGLVSETLSRRLRTYLLVEERPDVGLCLLRVPRTRGLARAMPELGGDPEVDLVTPVYSLEGSDEPILVTDEFVCQFKARVARTEQEELHRRHGVSVLSALDFAPRACVLRVPAGASVVDIANRYVESGLVEFAHADFVKPRAAKTLRRRPSAPLGRAGSEAEPRSLLDQEWHLRNRGQSGGSPGADARVLAAWETTRGASDLVLAVIDDGFDLDHGDFAPGRIVAPLDVRSGKADPRPRTPFENHGTCVLGVAGSGGAGSGVLGVAPGVSLMPIRLDGSERHEAQAIAAAVRAGAAVINCSWGPPDGDWWNPDDPRHRRKVPLPDVVAAAMRYAVEQGREGRGSVLVWAAGNGNESVSNDGYASSPHVVAVAASNHHDRRSVYSDFGSEVALCAPSSDLDRVTGTVGGIHATDRRGNSGYNPKGDYTDSFGGTSAAAPIVAGAVALMLSANAALDAAEVRAVLLGTAERINPEDPSWKLVEGSPHSELYGAGRLDAERMLSAARARAGRARVAGRSVTKRLRTR